MNGSRQAVLDSNLAVLAVIVSERTPAVRWMVDGLIHDGRQLIAPRLWRYEVTSAINKYRADKLLDQSSAAMALSRVLAMVEVVNEDVALCQAALIWAERLGQRAAYDGFYLALAERLGVELYTADERLANRAQQIGAVWVRGLGAG